MKKHHYKSDYQLQQIIDAINEGNSQEAIANATALYDNCKNMHDGLLDMFSLALNYIADKEGEEGIGKVWRYIGETKYIGIINAYKAGKMNYDFHKEYVRKGEMAHFSDFTAEEDDEKIVFSMHNCGVCGRMAKEKVLDKSEGDNLNLGTIKEPHDWTLGYSGMPYYCCHAPYFFKILGEEYGYDIFDFKYGKGLDENGNFVDGPCQEIIYKKPKSERA